MIKFIIIIFILKEPLRLSMKELLLIKFLYPMSRHHMVNKKKQSGVLVISTYPNEESIAEISTELIVAKKLCACISLTKVRSIYYWNNKLQDQEEFIVFFKTTKLRATSLKEEIRRLHPYEVPEILELKLDKVSRDYLSWLVQGTMPGAARLHK
jgi:periplasmic divalent cation tolerance protein